MGKAMLHHLGNSVSFGRLSLVAKVLWTMLLTAADDQGRGPAEADVVKWQVCPNVPELTPASIPAALHEMVQQGMLHLYSDGDRQLFQIIRWWDYQQLQWAQPSLNRPPDGWTDRVRVQRGRQHLCLNWDTPGGFLDGPPKPPPAEPPGPPPGSPPGHPPGDPSVDPPASPPTNPPDEPPQTPPDTPPGLPTKTKQDQPRLNQDQDSSPYGDARAGPVPDSKPASPRPRKGSDVPPAVQVFREAAHRYPPKAWFGKLDESVGQDQADLDFWQEVVTAWVGVGWNPGNVKGMLDFYKERQLPGRDAAGRMRLSGSPPDPLSDFEDWMKENPP